MIKRVVVASMIACISLLYAENQINYNPLMTQHLMQNEALGKEKFFLFDVGASEGIASYWKVFGENMSGVGFDPLVSECKRLNTINQFPGVIYVSSYIVSEITEIDQYEGKILEFPKFLA